MNICNMAHEPSFARGSPAKHKPGAVQQMNGMCSSVMQLLSARASSEASAETPSRRAVPSSHRLILRQRPAPRFNVLRNHRNNYIPEKLYSAKNGLELFRTAIERN
ncbi:hypothetical protein NDU88_001516 [Pleurodeles waltl]|uniref:Uncharacterized protein n=1 Tax=Pleurodeles waltl TaxID=8319 RepID=A0AAV7KTL5_PLEWA|nr:hypothetical protein NDU88_001516 [Pleurodeles waltl]